MDFLQKKWRKINLKMFKNHEKISKKTVFSSEAFNVIQLKNVAKTTGFSTEDHECQWVSDVLVAGSTVE